MNYIKFYLLNNLVHPSAASLMPTSMGTKPLSWPFKRPVGRAATPGLSLRHNHATKRDFYIYPWMNDRFFVKTKQGQFQSLKSAGHFGRPSFSY